MKVTKHAKNRIKDRIGGKKGNAARIAELALERGIPHSETKGRLNKWITSEWAFNKTANNIRLYRGKAFIFSGTTLITVLNIPNSLMKDFDKMIKQRKENLDD